MDSCELVLEAGKEELVLDRPPSIKGLADSCVCYERLSSVDIVKPGCKIHNNVTENVSNGFLRNITVSEEDKTDFPLFQKEETQINSINNESSMVHEAIETRNFQSENITNLVKPKFDNSKLSVSNNVVTNPGSLISSHIKSSKISKSKFNKSSYGKKVLVSCLKSNQSSRNNVRRKITFQEGTSIVSEYIEPVDPWKNVRTPSNTEVISFYRNSCQKLRCKPLDKVVKQIQEAPDLSQRAGTLVLRGSRLDSRSCEALESLFKRVRFENLDIESCSLDEEGSSALLEMIEFYRATCKLNIACNPKIGVRGWQALCRMLRKTPCLLYLDARRTILNDITMPCFGRCIKADPYLKVLHLEGVFLSGRPLLILSTAMKYNRVLEELYIGDNELTANDGPPLGAMLTYNTTLQLLDLRNNHIKDIGLAHIGKGLSDQAEQPFGGGLASLIVWNNGLTHEAMTYLSEGLIKTSSLKALNLGQNRIGDLGVQKLKLGLIKNKSLRKLGFLNTKLGSEGAVALAEVLADSLSLTRIDLRGNNLQVAGLMAFSMALRVNKTLIRLDLDKDIKNVPGMESVIQTVLVDIYNFCYRNKQLFRQTHNTSACSSTSSSPPISRQSSITSSTIICDDVFHPEEAKQSVVPFSPVTETVPDVFPQSSPSLTATDGIHVVAKSPPKSSPLAAVELTAAAKRSRFSVTKILDSIGNHAAGVANKIATNVASLDRQLKRNNSKEQTELLEVTTKIKDTLSISEEGLEPPVLTSSPEHSSVASPEHSSVGSPEHSSVASPEHSSVGSPEHSSVTTPEHSSVASPEHSSFGSPEHSSLGSPEHSSVASPEHSSVATPEHSSVASPEHSSVASPEHSSVASPEHSSVALPEHSSVASPEHSSVASPEHSSVASPEHSSVSSPEQSSVVSPERLPSVTTATSPFEMIDFGPMAIRKVPFSLQEVTTHEGNNADQATDLELTEKSCNEGTQEDSITVKESVTSDLADSFTASCTLPLHDVQQTDFLQVSNDGEAQLDGGSDDVKERYSDGDVATDCELTTLQSAVFVDDLCALQPITSW